MDIVTLTKSDFLNYRHCAKSLWLRKRKPDAVRWPAPGLFDRLLMQDGYKVEAKVKEMVAAWPDADAYQFQADFKSSDGLYARADMVRSLAGGAVDLFEIKASTSLKSSGGQDHVDDAAFQTLVAERSGTEVRSAHVIHVNKDYVRAGNVVPKDLLTIVDVTGDVRERIVDIAAEADEALALLRQAEIDEAGCSCLRIGKNNHCASFDYYNPDVPEMSVYVLPRMYGNRLATFVEEGRLALTDVGEDELSASQRPVLHAAITGEPVIDRNAIGAFLDGLKWPLHFYDYETFASAIPISDGIKPQQPNPVQFSHHLLHEDGRMEHYEFLSDAPGQQAELVSALQASFAESGSVVTWNKPFEMGCNRRMADYLPDKAGFLENVNDRTVDLMDPFKTDYVDIRFGGSTSIKKVLPVLCPHLAYDEDAVHDGGGAMAAWLEYIETTDGAERERLRQELLAYCKLDSLAMVEIYKALKAAL